MELRAGPAAGASCMHPVKCCGTKHMELRWATRTQKPKYSTVAPPRPPLVPIYISTDSSIINPYELRDLYTTCNLSCRLRSPIYVDSEDGRRVLEPMDIHKLRIAVSHSSIVVSVFCKPHHHQHDAKIERTISGLGDFIDRLMPPLSPLDAQLIGFGRAVSDEGLTASIYDVMVVPSLRRMGIGKMIVERIVRMLTNRGIYDIAALCPENERLFFEDCGFGDDELGSTTMMYTKNEMLL